MNKKEARRLALEKRKAFDVDKISKLIEDKIISSNLLSKYNNIGIYYPLKYEINLLGLIKYYQEKDFYLPKTKDILEFSKYSLNDTLVDGPFKTKEPISDSIDINIMDCVIIPCVSITKEKRRIGYGKGYYDKTLASYRGLKIGICYRDFTDLDVISDEYDLIMDVVISD